MEAKRELETVARTDEQQVTKKIKKNIVPYYKLFSFADSIDLALMTVGSVAAIANGLATPLGTLNFGSLINAFGQNTHTHIVVHEVSKVSLKFVYLGIGVCLAAFLQVACWTVTGERQASKIRHLYLKSLLRQDITFFDKETRTGEVIGRMSSDTLLIHRAIGEKVGQFIQLLSTFFGGFALAFVHGWQLALVMLATIPLIAFVAALMSNVITTMAANGHASYAEAADVVEQTIDSIRTVVSYGKDGATIKEIKAAAELANAMKFIDELPQGLDTMVGAHGTQLSGGEKQRVAIARAILKDPKILLLDEATSALDLESERMVQEALDKVMEKRTTIIVAHRLSTVRNADLITVLHQGSVIEKGSHVELTKNRNGVYSQLLHLQDVNQGMDHQNGTSREKQAMTAAAQSIKHSSTENISIRSLRMPTKEDDLQDSKLQEPECKKPTQKNKVPLSRLARLNKPELPVILLGTIAAVVSGMIMPAFGMSLANIAHTFYEPATELQKNSKFWSLMFLVLGFITMASVPARSYLFSVAGSKLIWRIRSMSFEKVMHMEIGWFDKSENSSGVIGAKLSADAAAVRSLVGDALALVVQNAATFITGLVIAFYSCWQLALLILALIPLMGLNGWIQLKLMKGYTSNVKMMYEGASQVVSDAVGSIRTVASFSAEEKVMELYKRKCEEPKNAGIKQGLISGLGFGLSFLLLFFSYATSFHVGAALIEDGKTTYTKVFRVFFVLAMVAFGVSDSSSLLPDAAKARSAAASVFAILDTKSKIHPGDNSTGMTLGQVKGNIELQHVCFKFPTRPDVQILKGLCLVVQSGKTVALVGESGSGKSTVISLLQRFYDPDSGSILLDGIEIQKFQVKWLRQQMGLVSQEPVLFNDTIRANIAYGKRGEATESEIVAAAELANAHQFISGLQQGYDTIVGERGVQLSGGQKQRVAIARAIIKEPTILLLDEATSALDAESEKVVQNALDRVMLKRTSVIIAHRLSTIKDADLIAVVKNGTITEKGKHEDLMNVKDGAYSTLVTLHTCH